VAERDHLTFAGPALTLSPCCLIQQQSRVFRCVLHSERGYKLAHGQKILTFIKNVDSKYVPLPIVIRAIESRRWKLVEHVARRGRI